MVEAMPGLSGGGLGQANLSIRLGTPAEANVTRLTAAGCVAGLGQREAQALSRSAANHDSFGGIPARRGASHILRTDDDVHTALP